MVTPKPAATEASETAGDAAASPLKLHIGGELRSPGWTVLNAQPGPAVDIVANCVDLSGFADASVSEIYASHVLEHLGFAEVPRALAEWCRVLQSGGRALISVPDLTKLGAALAHPKLPADIREWVIAVIYGGQTDPYDFHKMGFTADSLAQSLRTAGFQKIAQVDQFKLFDDGSQVRLGPTLISLNVIAYKP